MRATRTLLSFVCLLIALSVSAQSFVEYPIPSSAVSPEAIALGPDGAVWFLEKNANKIARITLSGTITEYLIPTAGAAPFGGIATGADGALWFTEDGANKVGRISVATGTITELSAPTVTSNEQYCMVRGTDGNLWFTEFYGNKIGKVTPTGTFTEYTIPTAASGPAGIALGPDNQLWFTEFSASKIARSSYDGQIVQYSLPNANSSPVRITTGPDGNLWFTETQGGRIGRITTSGVITEFNVPGGVTSLRDIVAAPDGNLYFTSPSSGKIGRVTTAGVITLIDLPTANAFPTFLTVGADGNLWISEVSPNKIAVLVLGSTAIVPAVASAPGALGSFFRTGVQLHNATAASISGNLVFHPSGQSGVDSDPALPYTLNAGETKSIADLVSAIGQSGLGSVDVVAKSGALPVVAARVFNDAGANGTTGFTEDVLTPDKALSSGDTYSLIVPADLARFRLNIGVRSLAEGASISVRELNSSGSVVRTATKTYAPNFFEQVSATAFLGGAPSANDALEVHVVSGSLFIYGATTDNTTQDPSIQLGHK